MATKAEAINYVNQNFQVDRVNDNLYKAVFTTENNRSQLIFITFTDEFIRFDSPFASEEDINANLVFKILEDSVFGARKIGTMYYLTNLLLIENIDANEIEDGIRLVAAAADQLESQVGGDNF